MTPPAHFLASWLTANAGGGSRRDRAIITIAGVIPDLDGVGYVIDWVAEKLGYTTHLYDYHHIVCHNLGFCLLTLITAFLLASKRWLTAGLCLAAFHLHLAMDLIGSKGPQGDAWEIPYLLPLSNAWQLSVPFQWPLDSWQNKLIGVALVIAVALLARFRGFSPFEIFSSRMDQSFVGLLKRIIPERKQT
jgi:LexA-binding, inner membrane-associated putative hydrolase